MSGQTITLSTGEKMPIIGLGTWMAAPNLTKQAVITAIKAGYRHIDTAFLYENEAEIGEALHQLFREGVVGRGDLFITTKLPPAYMRPEHVEAAFNKSLERLMLKYVDLYLIHMPMPSKFVTEGSQKELGMPVKEGTIEALLDSDFTDFTQTWKAMEAIYRSGRARHIGLSNFNRSQISQVLQSCTVKPHNLQVECHAMLTQEQLHKFCKENDISFTAYAPLGSPTLREITGNLLPSLLEDPTVLQIGRKYNRTAAQVLLRWLIQRDMAVIPKSTTPERIIQNFNVWNFYMDEEDCELLMQFPQKRFFTFKGIYANSHPNYPYNDAY